MDSTVLRAGGLWALAALAACAPSEPEAVAPVASVPAPARVVVPPDANLLFVSFDTTRADRISSYGHPRPTTPNFDRLAAQGHRFEHAYTPMPTTLPSHASMFTSLHPLELGVVRNRQVVPAEAATLAERLKGAGFETGAFVASVPLDAQFGLDQGFDVYRGTTDREERRAEVVAGDALAWLAERGPRRFFCFVHFFDAHTPYDPPDAARARFGVPPGVFARAPRVDSGFLLPSKVPSAETVANALRAYEAEISHADQELGALLDGLERLGLAERTVVVVTSDHGETLDELIGERKYAFDHGEFLHVRELRIPLAIRLPPGASPRAPAVHSEPVSTLDYLPTILELLDVRCDAPIRGRSLVPLLAGGALDDAPVVSCRHELGDFARKDIAGDEFSWIEGRWQLLESPRGRALFDLASDPQATRDLAAAEPARVESLSRALAEWRRTRGGALWGEAALSDDAKAAAELEKLGY